MTSRRLPSLGLEDLASVLDRDLSGLSEEALRALAESLAALYSEDPRHRDSLAELRAMADEAGCEFLGDALFAHRELEKLLASTTWSDPVELLGGERRDVAYPRLLCLASKRAERADDPGPWLVLIRRLARAFAKHESGG